MAVYKRDKYLNEWNKIQKKLEMKIHTIVLPEHHSLDKSGKQHGHHEP